MEKKKRFKTIFMQSDEKVPGVWYAIFVDQETGINYLCRDSSITPLLDQNGRPVVTETEK